MSGQGVMKAERAISRMMLDMGVPAHLKGFRYLRTAISMTYYDMYMVGSVTKLLYPEIAKQYNTTDSKVERAIRNAIEISWKRGNRDTFETLFGYNVLLSSTRPTNSEYIAAIADAVGILMNNDKGD